MNALLELVEDMAENSTDFQYLNAMNIFRELYEERQNALQNPTIAYIIREVVRENPVVRNHYNRTRMKIKENRVLSDLEKLKNGWKICKDCGRLISKNGMMTH